MANSDTIVEHLKDHRERALQGIIAANGMDEPEDWREIYDRLSPLEEDRTYTVELDLNDYEIVELHRKLLLESPGQVPADEMIVGTSVLAQILEQAPDHIDAIEEVDELDCNERGVY